MNNLALSAAEDNSTVDGDEGQDRNTAEITAEQLEPIVAAAIERLSQTSLTAEQIDTLQNTNVQIVDLADGILGLASENTIMIDVNAARYGWFVDPTPLDDSEFADLPLDADASQGITTVAPQQQMDLLTAVIHEMGHILGLDHPDEDNFMSSELPTGVRRVPTAADLDAVFGNHDLLDEILDN